METETAGDRQRQAGKNGYKHRQTKIDRGKQTHMGIETHRDGQRQAGTNEDKHRKTKIDRRRQTKMGTNGDRQPQAGTYRDRQRSKEPFFLSSFAFKFSLSN